jgi:hypothetical protein
MVVLAQFVNPDLKDDRTESPITPADRAELFRIIISLVNQVGLIEDLLCRFQADTMLSLNGAALRSTKFEAQQLYNSYTTEGILSLFELKLT